MKAIDHYNNWEDVSKTSSLLNFENDFSVSAADNDGLSFHRLLGSFGFFAEEFIDTGNRHHTA
jgi:hypothetical protein